MTDMAPDPSSGVLGAMAGVIVFVAGKWAAAWAKTRLYSGNVSGSDARTLWEQWKQINIHWQEQIAKLEHRAEERESRIELLEDRVESQEMALRECEGTKRSLALKVDSLVAQVAQMKESLKTAGES